jgi:hypothetical protein
VQIMNETHNPDRQITVYTDPANDPQGRQRAIPRGADVWYRGTCEADIICDVNAAAKVRFLSFRPTLALF